MESEGDGERGRRKRGRDGRKREGCWFPEAKIKRGEKMEEGKKERGGRLGRRREMAVFPFTLLACLGAIFSSLSLSLSIIVI